MKKKPKPEPLVQLREASEKLASQGQAKLADKLTELLALIAQEAAVRPSFAKKIAKLLGGDGRDQKVGRQERHGLRSRRRPPGVLDPFAIFKEGEAMLRRRLEELDVEQLKDIIAEYGMDRDKLAMKWKTTTRLIERIIETVRSRTSKGDAFRG